MLLQEEPTPLKVHELELEVEVLASSSRRNLPKETHLIYQLLEFGKLVRCDVCRRPHQTGKTVKMRNLRTGTIFSCGLNCLDTNFNVNARDLEVNTLVKKRLVRAWQRYVAPALKGKTFELTDKEWFRQIADFLPDAVSFDCPAAEELAGELRQMLRDWSAVTVGGYDTAIDRLVVFLSLQYDHRERPLFFKDKGKAYLDHPRLKDAHRLPLQQFFSEPSSLTSSQLAQLITVGDKLKKQRNLPLMVKHLKPYNFANQETYKARLAELAHDLADSDSEDIEQSHIQTAKGVTKDLIHNIKRGGLAFHTVADRDVSKVAYLELPAYLRASAQEVGGDLYFSDCVHETRPLTVQMNTGSVRSMQRSAQLEDKEEANRPEPKPVYYRTIAVWKPDVWHLAYEMWFKYGGIDKGRARLEDLRGILNTTF